jgi:pimeloyl-ACP methyl ester carboxylesterase
MAPTPLPRGGEGDPLVLVHGLMGRGSTWSRQLPWLTSHGEVYTYDAPWHCGRDVAILIRLAAMGLWPISATPSPGFSARPS